MTESETIMSSLKNIKKCFVNFLKYECLKPQNENMSKFYSFTLEAFVVQYMYITTLHILVFKVCCRASTIF